MIETIENFSERTEIKLSKEQSNVVLDSMEISYGEGLLSNSKEVITLMQYIFLKYPSLFETRKYLLSICDDTESD